MAEFANTFVQQIAANANAVFTETPVAPKSCIVHREGSGVITLRGNTNQCYARYLVVFGGNIAIPTGGTVDEISIAMFSSPRSFSPAIEICEAFVNAVRSGNSKLGAIPVDEE